MYDIELNGELKKKKTESLQALRKRDVSHPRSPRGWRQQE